MQTNWIEITALVVGPLLAVALTLWRESFRQTRERKFNVLRLLLTTRVNVSDPSFTTSINMVPVEFGHNPAVMTAWENFMHAANAHKLEDTQLLALLKAIMLDLGFKERAANQVGRDPYLAAGLGNQRQLGEAVAKGLLTLAEASRLSAHASTVMAEHVTGKPLPPLPPQ